jgi:hypothetical protein
MRVEIIMLGTMLATITTRAVSKVVREVNKVAREASREAEAAVTVAAPSQHNPSLLSLFL